MFRSWLFSLSFLAFIPAFAAIGESGTAPEFVKIHFVDGENGWAQTLTTILRTSDGGKTWRKLAPAGGDSACGIAFRSSGAVFQDSETAWTAFVLDETAMVSFRRTTDGGTHWIGADFAPSRTTAMFVQSNLAFSDKQHGWLMLAPDHGMNSSPGILYRTKNGGKTWGEVASTNDRLPHGGAIFFRDASIGWLVGADTTTTANLLSVTRDGGATWKFQKLPLPPGLPDGDLEPASLPIFFGVEKKDGILAADCSHNSDIAADDYAYTVIYCTHDDGQTWHPTTPVKMAGVINFINVREGWIWASDPDDYRSGHPVKGTLCNTRDGGKTWSPIKSDAGLQKCLIQGNDIVQLDFIDREHGWAVVQGENSDARGLLQTSDGGKTWAALDASIQP